MTQLLELLARDYLFDLLGRWLVCRSVDGNEQALEVVHAEMVNAQVINSLSFV